MSLGSTFQVTSSSQDGTYNIQTVGRWPIQAHLRRQARGDRRLQLALYLTNRLLTTYPLLYFYQQTGPAKGTLYMAREMIIVHNILLRGANSIYLQCVNVGQRGTPEHVSAFVSYCRTWAALLHEHHEGEEDWMFPTVEAMAGVPGLMAANVDQHKAFHDGLEELEAYLKRVEDGAEKYDGEKLRTIFDSFMPALRRHLDEEIPTIVGLAKYEDKADWEKWYTDKVTEILTQNVSTEFKVRTWILFESARPVR